MTAPTRDVVHGDAIAFLREHPRMPGASLVASLPDVSELGISLERWREFFLDAARAVLEATPDDGLAFFFQTDLKHEGRWISKASMVLRAGEELGVPLVFHKLVCRREPGQIVRGRPGYSHFLAFSRTIVEGPELATPDVLPDLGAMPWSHSMGTRSAELAVTTVRKLSPSTTKIVVPFCGIGTALAIANRHGFDAIGIERKRKRAEAARVLVIE